jgi:hypothetical protein
VANLVHHLVGVIHRAVVGAQLDDRQPERAYLVGVLRGGFPLFATKMRAGVNRFGLSRLSIGGVSR